MTCLECGREVGKLGNEHLLGCCGLTLQEYAIRHRLPLDLLVTPDMVNAADRAEDYPSVCRTPGEMSRIVLEGLQMAGLVQQRGVFQVIPGEVRRLELLLWDLQHLRDHGFRFRQEYLFDESTNRVVARNCLKTLRRNLIAASQPVLSLSPPPDFMSALAVCLAHAGELHGGYLFLPLARRRDTEDVLSHLTQHYRIRMVVLQSSDDGSTLLRCATRADSERLIATLQPWLKEMPGVPERFTGEAPRVTVAKEVVFDSAHFITDHPAKCSNLHGGRYVLHVKVQDRIDPTTGCVVDYGYLKNVVQREVVELFDHHNLNYVAGELAWRSTTELLCVFVWERLIQFLPGLAELELYETPQSWCRYVGPSLEEIQARGPDPLLRHFQQKALGLSPLRRLVANQESPCLLAGAYA